MGLPAKNEGGKFEKDIIEADNHLAICYQKKVVMSSNLWRLFKIRKSQYFV